MDSRWAPMQRCRTGFHSAVGMWMPRLPLSFRNRIHAKRTRDRRKKFMEDAEKVRRTTRQAGRAGWGRPPCSY